MKLSLVIPVWNDWPGVRSVISQAIETGVFCQIIVSDDGSDLAPDLAPDLADVTGADTADAPSIKVIRSEVSQGAGQARNRALDHVTGSHVLFFDADDRLRPEFAELVKRLQGQEFDFCMFRHVEGRRRAEGHEGLFAKDEDLWRRANALHPLARLRPEGAHFLSQVAAYPWNKIYRTDFLRENAIRCGTTQVHNDIELHWMGFVHANIILCSDLLCCEHVVGVDKRHLTNRNGQERLQVFDALTAVLAQLQTAPPGWRYTFTCFFLDLLGWARLGIDPEWRPEFDRRAHDLVRSHIDQPLFGRINRGDPLRARRVTEALSGGR